MMEMLQRTCVACEHVANVGADSLLWACPRCSLIQRTCPDCAATHDAMDQSEPGVCDCACHWPESTPDEEGRR